MPKSVGTEIFHSTGQTEMKFETVLITMALTSINNEKMGEKFFFVLDNLYIYIYVCVCVCVCVCFLCQNLVKIQLEYVIGVQFCIFNVYNFSKNVHNSVHSMYTIYQTMKAIL